MRELQEWLRGANQDPILLRSRLIRGTFHHFREPPTSIRETLILRNAIGVVLQPGDRFHIHYAEEDLGVCGRFDAYAMASGSILKLPLR